MKISIIIIMATVFQVSATSYAQRVTLKVSNYSLEDILRSFRSQTGYDFLYDADQIKSAKPITLSITNAPLNEALQKCLIGQPFSYQINAQTVVIKRQEVNGEIIKQQAVQVTGRVTDEKKMPIPGVNIKVKDAQQVFTTDKNGDFKITVTNLNATLVFTSIAYIAQEVPLKGRSVLNVVLLEQNSGLDEVVIIGYGEVKRQDLTGAVSTVRIDELQKAPVRSFEEALAGRIAGVQVVSGDGQPGAAANIIVRGNNSLTQDNSPLYVIDGFPLENPNNNVINPDDIETIDVLKDASATAIYGARGANGVVMITTKKGKGATTLTYNGFYGNSSAIKKLEVLSPYEFVRLQVEAFSAQADSLYLKNATLEDYRNVPAVSWLDELLQSAPFQNHNLAIRGGNTNGTNYSVSGSIIDQTGIIINSGFKRYQGRVIVNQKINDKLLSGINLNYAKTRSFGSIVSQYVSTDYQFAIIPNAIGYRPLGGALGSGGNIDDFNDELIDSDLDPSVSTTSDYRYNPVSSLKNELNNRELSDIIANAFLQYKIIPELTLKISGGINYSSNTNNVFNNSHTRSGDIRTPQGANGPNGTVFNSQVNNFITENTLTFNKKIRKNHNLNALAGFTFQGNDYSAFGYTANQVPNENLEISGIDEGLPSRIRSSKSSNRMESFLGRMNYNYKSIYYLTASYRVDGSSKFAPENHWSYFPSVGASWRISKEKFLQKFTFISDAKFRVSYGKTGNNRVTDFAYLSTLTLPIAANYSFGNTYFKGAALTTLGNPNLKWETTDQIDVGLDLELLKGRITAAIDYYDKKTSNLLLNANLPGSTGFTNSFQNIGKVQNSGLELTLSTINFNKANFSWNTSFNISFNRNKVLALVSGQESILSYTPWSVNQYSTAPNYIAKIGHPIAQMYGYVFDGIYQYADFDRTTNGAYVLKSNIPNNGNARTSLQPGFIRFKDLNGDGIVNTQDQTTIGRPYPLHFGGLSNNFRYKNLDLNLFFQWSYGNDIINANRYRFEGNPKFNQNALASYANRWTPENQSSTIPAYNGYGNQVYTDRVIEDGSYLRLKTAQLGYNFQGKTLTKMGIKSLRIYASGQNVLTWTNYTGQDPEVSTYTGALTPGFDFSAYPRARTFTFGANFSL